MRMKIGMLVDSVLNDKTKDNDANNDIEIMLITITANDNGDQTVV